MQTCIAKCEPDACGGFLRECFCCRKCVQKCEQLALFMQAIHKQATHDDMCV